MTWDSVILRCHGQNMLDYAEIGVQYTVTFFIVARAVHFFYPLDWGLCALIMLVFSPRLPVPISDTLCFLKRCTVWFPME
jgi:hypothetical protein